MLNNNNQVHYCTCSNICKDSKYFMKTHMTNLYNYGIVALCSNEYLYNKKKEIGKANLNETLGYDRYTTNKHVKTCYKCGSSQKLMKCSRCKTVHYCSKECQKSDWGRHKSSCN